MCAFVAPGGLFGNNYLYKRQTDQLPCVRDAPYHFLCWQHFPSNTKHFLAFVQRRLTVFCVGVLWFIQIVTMFLQNAHLWIKWLISGHILISRKKNINRKASLTMYSGVVIYLLYYIVSMAPNLSGWIYTTLFNRFLGTKNPQIDVEFWQFKTLMLVLLESQIFGVFSIYGGENEMK